MDDYELNYGLLVAYLSKKNIKISRPDTLVSRVGEAK